MLAESVPPEKAEQRLGCCSRWIPQARLPDPCWRYAFCALTTSERCSGWRHSGGLTVLIAALGIREVRRTSSGTPKGTAASWRDLPGRFYYVLMVVALFSLGNSSDCFSCCGLKMWDRVATRRCWVWLQHYYRPFPASRLLSDRLPKRVIAAAGYAVFPACICL